MAKSSDTIIVKRQHLLTKSYEVGFYSKSYSYYWLAGKDTLDFILNASERKKDYRKYAPDADLADYPEIIIGGMNLYVHLENTGS